MVDYVGQMFGHHRLLRVLGRGAFATVYLGEHQYLERPAAIKVLHVQMDSAAQNAFQHEARTIARLHHPHIIGVHDFGIENQIPYLVMEYSPGGTLRSHCPKGTQLSFESIVQYVKQIASALDYAHRQHVIHRDIKPENLLLNADGTILLSDFGLAVVERTLSSLSIQNLAGTPLYMAPEQIQHQPCAASDQYALGVIVYEWITGEPPFRGSLFEIFSQHLHTPPPPLCERFPHLPPAVEDTVFGALAKDPRLRFSCVQDFALALEEACFATQPLSIPEIIAPESHAPSSEILPVSLGARSSHASTTVEPTQIVSKPLTPVLIVSVCARTDRSFLEQWEAHLRSLEQAGDLTIWSEDHLLVGTPRQQQINEHMEQADLIVLLLSADFFSSDDCIAWMQYALSCRQKHGAHIMPLLLRPVQWQASPLASLPYVPSNGVAITTWSNQDAAFRVCVKEICRLLGRSVSSLQTPQQSPMPLSAARRNRTILLRRVRSFWIEGVLSHSLHGAALLALGLETHPTAVANPWHLVLQHPDTTCQRLPPGIRITQVYDDADGELLILGAPGSGKTTLLLELARDLLTRADHDEQHPMPVVFNLSSWASKQSLLEEWLVEELITKYTLPPRLAHALVEADQILPLLDGLDEVAAKERTACIDAINAYRGEHGLGPLVVCSRSTDYLTQTARVRLGHAVMIQPLTQEQVIDSLSAVGPQVEALRTALLLDTDLQELATTPLMLNILILAYQGMPLERIAPLGKLPLKQQQVFATCVQRMLTSRKAASSEIPERTLSWLTFLAQKMKQRNQTIFYLEHMQPDWIVDKHMRWRYDWFAVRLPYILIGGLVGLAPYPMLFPVIWTPFLTQVILLGGLLGWLLGEESTTQQFLAGSREKVRGIPWYWLLQQLGLAAFLGSGMGLSFWEYKDNPLRGLIAGLSFTVCCFLLLLLLRKRNILRVSGQRMPQWHLVRGKVVLNALFVGLFSGLSSALDIALYGELKTTVLYGLLFLMFGVLSGGLLSILLIGRHAAIQPTDRLIWTWQSFRRSLFSKHHVRTSLQIAGMGLLLFSTILWLAGIGAATIPIFGLLIGSIIGLCYWLLLGFFRGVASTTIDDRLRTVPNQGIHHSALNALRYGLVAAILVGLGGERISTTWTSDLITSLSVGLLTGLFNGGLACLRHYMLRILLWRSGAIPWDYPHFLNAVAKRILLRKVGGGYIFVHRLLLDYLATLGTNELAGRKNAIRSYPITPTALLPCGHEMHPNARFCSTCGAAVPP